ncbi:hypothetical protein FA15DRAFT_756722 [Coprinopsis marcescibilis]|uniref:Uncharacterized protein n=1 Tax=Coprinopsis marcescibilis TaxID=230819 RepID=A0A5C3L7F5_COPMA|nr:hypothetical protein FA15DRAFT_756722 [Coprinopsis marcescibilis]
MHRPPRFRKPIPTFLDVEWNSSEGSLECCGPHPTGNGTNSVYSRDSPYPRNQSYDDLRSSSELLMKGLTNAFIWRPDDLEDDPNTAVIMTAQRASVGPARLVRVSPRPLKTLKRVYSSHYPRVLAGVIRHGSCSALVENCFSTTSSQSMNALLESGNMARASRLMRRATTCRYNLSKDLPPLPRDSISITGLDLSMSPVVHELYKASTEMEESDDGASIDSCAATKGTCQEHAPALEGISVCPDASDLEVYLEQPILYEQAEALCSPSGFLNNSDLWLRDYINKRPIVSSQCEPSSGFLKSRHRRSKHPVIIHSPIPMKNFSGFSAVLQYA